MIIWTLIILEESWFCFKSVSLYEEFFFQRSKCVFAEITMMMNLLKRVNYSTVSIGSYRFHILVFWVSFFFFMSLCYFVFDILTWSDFFVLSSIFFNHRLSCNCILNFNLCFREKDDSVGAGCLDEMSAYDVFYCQPSSQHVPCLPLCRLGPCRTISYSNTAIILAEWDEVPTTSPNGCRRTTGWDHASLKGRRHISKVVPVSLPVLCAGAVGRAAVRETSQ